MWDIDNDCNQYVAVISKDYSSEPAGFQPAVGCSDAVATIISRSYSDWQAFTWAGCMGIFYTIMIVANTMFRGSLFLG